MDLTLLIITIIGASGGFAASSYVSYGKNNGWPVGHAFKEKGLATIIGGLMGIIFIILSVIYNKWWTLLIVIFAAIILAQILIRIFKSFAQILSIILIIVGLVSLIIYL